MALINTYPDDNAASADDKYLTYDNSGTVKLTPASVLREFIGGTPTNYNATVTGFSAVPAGAVYRYILINKLCTLFITQPNNGTSNGTGFNISLPFQAANVATGFKWSALLLQPVNNGTVNTTTPGIIEILNNDSQMTLYRDLGGGSWTNTGGKRAPSFTIQYEIA